MAENGKSLKEVTAVAKRVVANMGTIGLALTPCVLPGESTASFSIPDDSMELGLGIHGEAGARREKLQSAQEVAAQMVRHMTAAETGCALSLQAMDRVVLLVNNLGSASVMEMMTMSREIAAQLGEAVLPIVHVLRTQTQ